MCLLRILDRYIISRLAPGVALSTAGVLLLLAFTPLPVEMGQLVLLFANSGIIMAEYNALAVRGELLAIAAGGISPLPLAVTPCVLATLLTLVVVMVGAHVRPPTPFQVLLRFNLAIAIELSAVAALGLAFNFGRNGKGEAVGLFMIGAFAYAFLLMIFVALADAGNRTLLLVPQAALLAAVLWLTRESRVRR